MLQRTRLPIRVLFARLVLLALMPVALLSAWSIAETVSERRSATERSVLELSRALASAVEADLEATRQSLAALGRSSALINADIDAFQVQAAHELETHPEWDAVILATARGELVFNTSLSGRPRASRIVDQASMDRAIQTGAPVVGRLLDGRFTKAFAVRIPIVVDGTLAYVLSAAVKPDRMVQVLVRQRQPKGWAIAVFDSAQVRVARSIDQSGTVGGAASSQLRSLFARPGTDGVGLSTTVEGEEVYTGFTRVGSDGWVVAVGAPTRDLKAALIASVGWHLGGIALSLLACYLLGRRIVRRIEQDVAHIRGEAVQLSEGRIVKPRPSEIAEFDDMAQALAQASVRLSDNARVAGEALAAADAATRAKDEFLAVLGHELRNPLAPMLNALHLIDLKAPQVAVREREIMRRQIEHMRRLVDDLLDVSRIVGGKLEIRREPVLLQTVLDRSIETVFPTPAGRTDRLVVALPAQPVWVRGDETRLVQAVSNLLTNALRYGGEEAITLVLEAAGDTARVIVRDRGMGMDEQTLQQAFEVFYQAPQGSARQNGGLGLGLAIVRSVVSLHEGRVHAFSAGLGQGSTFTVELPAIGPPAAASSPAPGATERQPARVAIVDDNADALEMISEALRRAGHQVEALDGAAQALSGIPRSRPDIAVLDIGMPGMDGFALAAALRNAGWSGPLIALTGYGLDADKERARQAGFAMHFTKPVDVAALLSAIDAVLPVRRVHRAG